jgi:hypothetical protein
MSEHVRAPFSMEAAFALNSYRFGAQSWGHPYTCPRDHGVQVRLVAMPDGWHCPVDTCDYRQGWAHAAHTEPGGPEPDPIVEEARRRQRRTGGPHWNIDTTGAVDERGYVAETDAGGWVRG